MTLEKLQGTTLVVGVHQQAWLQELYILSSVIIKTINDQLDEHKIEKIQFKLAASKKKTERPIEQINTFNTKNITLTKKEEITLTTIQDPELREALKSFLIRCKKRNNV